MIHKLTNSFETVNSVDGNFVLFGCSAHSKMVMLGLLSQGSNTLHKLCSALLPCPVSQS
jgi:hypothetical protein